MTTDSSYSRRRVLQLIGAVTTGALSGCLGFLSGSDPSVIENVTFDGTRMVVHLVDDTNADAIDLRSPSDKLLHTASIGRKSSVALSLTKKPYTPYPPGTYTLDAIKTDDTGSAATISTRSLELTSSIEVSNVRPMTTDQDSSGDNNPPPTAGPVHITLSNTGNLPVGIAYLGFTQGVPSPDPLPKNSIGTYSPISNKGRFLPGGAQRMFKSFGAPLRHARPPGQQPKQRAAGAPKQGASWTHIKQSYCNGEQHTATLLVVPTQGNPLKTAVTITYSGTAVRHDPLAIDYACSNVTVDNTSTKNTPTPSS